MQASRAPRKKPTTHWTTDEIAALTQAVYKCHSVGHMKLSARNKLISEYLSTDFNIKKPVTAISSFLRANPGILNDAVVPLASNTITNVESTGTSASSTSQVPEEGAPPPQTVEPVASGYIDILVKCDGALQPCEDNSGDQLSAIHLSSYSIGPSPSRSQKKSIRLPFASYEDELAADFRCKIIPSDLEPRVILTSEWILDVEMECAVYVNGRCVGKQMRDLLCRTMTKVSEVVKIEYDCHFLPPETWKKICHMEECSEFRIEQRIKVRKVPGWSAPDVMEDMMDPGDQSEGPDAPDIILLRYHVSLDGLPGRPGRRPTHPGPYDDYDVPFIVNIL